LFFAVGSKRVTGDIGRSQKKAAICYFKVESQQSQASEDNYGKPRMTILHVSLKFADN
jgi:hypothetical protein